MRKPCLEKVKSHFLKNFCFKYLLRPNLCVRFLKDNLRFSATKTNSNNVDASISFHAFLVFHIHHLTHSAFVNITEMEPRNYCRPALTFADMTMLILNYKQNINDKHASDSLRAIN